MEAGFGGGFTYGGRFWEPVVIWKQILEANSHMEADF
jgi:hypothetical protein